MQQNLSVTNDTTTLKPPKCHEGIHYLHASASLLLLSFVFIRTHITSKTFLSFSHHLQICLSSLSGEWWGSPLSPLLTTCLLVLCFPGPPEQDTETHGPYIKVDVAGCVALVCTGGILPLFSICSQDLTNKV